MAHGRSADLVRRQEAERRVRQPQSLPMIEFVHAETGVDGVARVDVRTVDGRHVVLPASSGSTRTHATTEIETATRTQLRLW